MDEKKIIDSIYDQVVTTQINGSEVNYVYDLPEYLKRNHSLKHCIQKGKFGNVYATEKNQKKFVLKTFEDVEEFETEIKIFSLLRNKSENIIQLYNIFLQDDMEKGCFIMEQADTDLHYYLSIQETKFSLEKLKYMFCQILNGLTVCHEHGIVHGDLKSANLLVFGDGERICLGDFGSSYRTNEDEEDSPVSGLTIMYQPPEMILTNDEQEYYFDESIDIWACGAIFLELIHREYVFYNVGKIGTLMKIFQQLGTPSVDSPLRKLEYWNDDFPRFHTKHSTLWDEVDAELVPILKPMLNYIPEKRPTSFTLLQTLQK